MAKKVSDNRAYLALQEDIRRGTPGQLYIFYGTERFLLENALAELRLLLIPDGMEEFNYRTFSGRDLDVSDLLSAMDSPPMMNERTLIVVTDFDLFGCAESKREALLTAFSELPETLCLVFVYDVLEYKAGQGKLRNLVKQVGSIVEFAPASQEELIGWIQHRFAARGKEIRKREADYLIERGGNLMSGLVGEIEKVASFAADTQITQADIDAVVDPVLEARVFDMTDAVSNRNFPLALQVLADLYALNQHPIMILTILGRNLRQLYTARLVLEAGADRGMLTEMWKLKSGWQADRLMRCARSCTLPWCRNAVQLCSEADFAMKSTGRDPEEVLTDLMLHLAAR